MINRRFTALLLQLVLAVAGQQMLMGTQAFAQESTPADATAVPADSATPAVDPTAPASEPVQDAAAVPDVASAAAASTAEQKNPYGLGALWSQGDLVARGTLVILLIMSMVTWYIMLTKLWEQQRLLNQGSASRKVWEAASLAEGAQKLPKNSAYRGIVEDGLNAVKHHDGRLTDRIDLQEWVTMTVQRAVEGINSQMQGGLAFLATTGSTAPFIGLFGTVWGIYHALVAIGMAGQASIDKVAGPVGEALIMTAIGLAVAVPAVLGYNWMVRRNKIAMEDVRAFSSDVHAVLLMGVRVADPSGVKVAGAAATPRSK